MLERTTLEEVLKPSPNFGLEYTFEGKPFLSTLTAPYHRALHMGEPHRRMLMCFAGTGTSVREALRSFLKLESLPVTAEHQTLVYRLVKGLKDFQALVTPEDPASMYNAEMARAYLEHRTMPTEVSGWVARAAALRKKTRVLDLASGTGALANALAQKSALVTGMDVSASFLKVAAEDARARGVQVDYRHESANRLLFHEAKYDVVTVSLAFHWMDPYLAALGIYNVLKPGGRLLIVDGYPLVPKRHPLYSLYKRARPFSFASRRRFYTALFSVAREANPLRCVQRFEFREKRNLDIPYSRAFLSKEHLKELKAPGWEDTAAFWRNKEKKVGAPPESAFRAEFRWGVSLFRA